MTTRKNPEDLTKRNTVRIPFAHLNPELQQIIGKRAVFERPWAFKIREARTYRAACDAFSLVHLLNLARSPHREFWLVSGLGNRTLLAIGIQIRHDELLKRMKSHGILQTKHEERYPRDWINPTTVSLTHPIFYVGLNGDLVFKKPSRKEYYYYLYQKNLPGRLGLNPWMWRVNIRPPEAPEKIREWAKRKIKEERERLRRRKPVPVPAPVRLMKRRPLKKPI